MVKNIKNFIANLFRSSKKTASPAKQHRNDRAPSVREDSNTHSRQERSARQTASEKQPYSGGDPEDMAQGFLAAGFVSSSSSSGSSTDNSRRNNGSTGANETGTDADDSAGTRNTGTDSADHSSGSHISAGHNQKNDQNNNRETYE
ncbi:MAG: hypothetical protein D3903_15960, partial [Candidatus Electrothrix sp. GM3_4]|nr:hypothetical protein [Candidatus Electrothrix sp. GM3_4]